MDPAPILQRQRRYFDAGMTQSLDVRLLHLKRLRRAIGEMREQLAEALRLDLGKGEAESHMTEIGMALSTIRYLERHLRAFARPRPVAAPMAVQPAFCFERPQPLGTVLIISPWNYPLLLCVGPAAEAIAAGNTVVIKPSELAPQTAQMVERLFTHSLPPELAAVVTGDRDAAQALLDERFDHIFYTGGARVGRLVLEAAAKHLTPVTLELGGKSPCIVDETADLKLAARRILFGKTLNAGQTCVAPDYLLVHQKAAAGLLAAMRAELRRRFPDGALAADDYPRIVNEAHFVRLCGLMRDADILLGGGSDAKRRRIEPTVLVPKGGSHPSMREEIFGPVLPMLTVSGIDEAFAAVKKGEKPLAAYLFTRDNAVKRRFVQELSFGGCCINDTVMQLAVPGLAFGGVGQSGMGGYHGRRGFETFSHRMSVMERTARPELPMRYRPYGPAKLRLLRMFLW